MPTSALRIIPIVQLPAFLAATALGGDADGLGASKNIYSIADAARPRTPTHRSGASIPNAAQMSWLHSAGTTVVGYVDLATVDPNPPSLDGCIVKLWTVPGPSPEAGILAAEGLTTDPNFEP